MIVGLAARASLQVQQDFDSDTKEFLRELRSEVIESYTTILMSAHDTGHLELFNQYLEGIFDFL